MERSFWFLTTSNLKYYLAIDDNKGYYLDNNIFSKFVIKYPANNSDKITIEKQLKTVMEIWQLNISKIKLSADVQEYELNIGSEF